MLTKYKDSCPEMSWFLADVTDLSRWADDTYDVIIDKGCVDAMVYFFNFLLFTSV